MSIRDKINNNPNAVTAIAVIALALALTLVIWQGGGGSGVSGAYYYDPDDGRLFRGEVGGIPPVETPYGNRNGLRANIYACGGCPRGIDGMTLDELEATNAFITHFERYTDEAKQLIEQYWSAESPEPDPEAEEAIESGLYVQIPGTDRWHPLHSAEGMEVIDARMDACEGTGEPIRACRP